MFRFTHFPPLIVFDHKFGNFFHDFSPNFHERRIFTAERALMIEWNQYYLQQQLEIVPWLHSCLQRQCLLHLLWAIPRYPCALNKQIECFDYDSLNINNLQYHSKQLEWVLYFHIHCSQLQDLLPFVWVTPRFPFDLIELTKKFNFKLNDMNNLYITIRSSPNQYSISIFIYEFNIRSFFYEQFCDFLVPCINGFNDLI